MDSSLFHCVDFDSPKRPLVLRPEFGLVMIQIHHLLGKIPLIHNLLLTRLSQLEVFVLYFVHLASDSVYFILNPPHLLMRVLELLFHFLHLASLFL